MRELPVRRREAEALGLIQPGEKLTVPPGLAEWGLPQAVDGMGRAGASDLTPEQQQRVIDRCDEQGIKVVREEPQQSTPPTQPNPVAPRAPQMPQPVQPQYTPSGPSKPVPPPSVVEPERPVQPAPQEPVQPKPVRPKAPALRVVPNPNNPADPLVKLEEDWLDAWLVEEAQNIDAMPEDDWLGMLLGGFLADKIFRKKDKKKNAKSHKQNTPW
jgi:hypothetical protein